MCAVARRVLFYFAYNQNMTGGPRTLLRLLDNLDAKKIHPIFVTQKDSPLCEAVEERNIPVHIVPLPETLDVYNGRLLEYNIDEKIKAAQKAVRYNTKIADLCREENVQCIWGRNIKSVLLTGLAAGQLNCPLIWDIGLERQGQGFVYFLHLIGLFFSSTVVVQAKQQPEFVFGKWTKTLFNRKIEVIHPGFDSGSLGEAKESIDGEDNRFRIISVGTVDKRKNQLMLLESVARLVRACPNVVVDIVGPWVEKEYYERLVKFVREHDITENVRFLGWRDDIVSLMARANVIVMCSRNEGIPTALREAMHVGLPVIATRAGGMPDAVKEGETGYLVELGDVETLTSYLKRMAENPLEARSMGKKGTQLVKERFSLEAWASRYSELLERLIS